MLPSPCSRMPSCLRTVLEPPSHPTRYEARIVSSAAREFSRTAAVTLDCVLREGDQFAAEADGDGGELSTMDRRSGSRVYCEMN